MKKLYETLGISENASQSEIKKAYRKLATKYHPDKNQDNKEEAESNFKEITRAYEVLSDQDKKNMYDQLGDEGFERQNMGGGDGGFSDPMDFFSKMFGFNMGGGMNMNMDDMHENPFSFMFGGGGRRNEAELEDIVIRRVVNIKQLYTGDTIQFDFTRKTFCIMCSSSGTKNGKKSTCTNCGGTGRMKRVHQMGMMVQQIISDCNVCNGSGKYIEKGNECSQCNGHGMIDERISSQIKLEKNMIQDNKIQLPVHGHKNIKGKTSRVILVLDIEAKYKNYEIKQGLNLFTKVNISLADALCGFSMNIDYVDDRPITIIRRGTTQPSSVYKIPKLGYDANASLFIQFNVILPESVPKNVFEIVNETWGKEPAENIMSRTYNLEIRHQD